MKQIPREPGRYYWTEWAQYVDVYTKGRGTTGRLYVKIPGGVEVRITSRIAGSFLLCQPK